MFLYRLPFHFCFHCFHFLFEICFSNVSDLSPFPLTSLCCFPSLSLSSSFPFLTAFSFTPPRLPIQTLTHCFPIAASITECFTFQRFSSPNDLYFWTCIFSIFHLNVDSLHMCFCFSSHLINCSLRIWFVVFVVQSLSCA